MIVGLVAYMAGMVIGLARYLTQALRVGRRVRKRESASKEPWGATPALGSPALLSSVVDAPDDNALISKPVLLG